MPVINVVERLDHRRLPQVGLQQPAAGQLAGVQVGDVPIPSWVVVIGVDYGLADQRPHGHAVIGQERDGHHDQVACIGRFLRRRRARHQAELAGQLLECVRAARVTEHHRVPGRHGEPRDGAADHSAADEPHSCHNRPNRAAATCCMRNRARGRQRTRSRGPGGRVLAAFAQAPQRLAVAERERGFQPRALLNFRQVHHGINEAGPAPRGHVPRG